MATIPFQRIHYRGMTQSQLEDLRHLMPHSGDADTIVPGDAAILDAGHVDTGATTNEPGANTLVGLFEQYASSPSADDLLLVSLALPGQLIEVSADASGFSDEAVVGEGYESVDNAVGMVLDEGATTTDVFIVLGFASTNSKFTTGKYTPGDGSTAVAGSTNTPDAGKGIAGDTQPRMLCLWAQGILVSGL